MRLNVPVSYTCLKEEKQERKRWKKGKEREEERRREYTINSSALGTDVMKVI